MCIVYYNNRYLEDQPSCRHCQHQWNWRLHCAYFALANAVVQLCRKHLPQLRSRNKAKSCKTHTSPEKVGAKVAGSHTAPVLCHLEHVGSSNIHVTVLLDFGGIPVMNELMNEWNKVSYSSLKSPETAACRRRHLQMSTALAKCFQIWTTWRKRS